MKKKFFVNLIFAVVAGVISFSAMENKTCSGNLKSMGGPPYNTNAPTEKTCSGTEGTNSCHSGGIADNSGPATCSIISSGGNLYIPGQTYTITPTITHATRMRFGFQFTARQASNNSNTGSISLLDTNLTWTEFPGYGNCQTCEFVMHKKAGTYFATTTGSWSFKWTAPSSNVGNIKMYACFLAANNNNLNDSGDECYYASLTLSPSGTGINEENFSSSISVFPNPSADGKFQITSNKTQITKTEIYNSIGEKIYSSILLNNSPTLQLSNSSTLQLDLSSQSSGIYFLKIFSGEKTALKKIILE